jgi:hypothetical protein
MKSKTVKLSDGREVEIDLSRITIAEHRSLFNAADKQENEDRLLCRVCGLALDEFQKLPMYDWKLITEAYFWLVREPVYDPNSQSASTST